MKKISLLAMIATTAVILTSCHVQQAIMPKAINTMAEVSLGDLNFDRKDYVILKNISAEAIVKYHQRGDEVTISEENGSFSITWEYEKKLGIWVRTKFEGIAQFGFLGNDYDGVSTTDIAPEYFVRNLAMYRAINACKASGGDAIIEPLISTNVEQMGKDIVFKTNVTGKIIKIKTDK